MRFHLALKKADESQFHEKKLREVVLSRVSPQSFALDFSFSSIDVNVNEPVSNSDSGEIPEYVMVEETA